MYIFLYTVHIYIYVYIYISIYDGVFSVGHVPRSFNQRCFLFPPRKSKTSKIRKKQIVFFALEMHHLQLRGVENVSKSTNSLIDSNQKCCMEIKKTFRIMFFPAGQFGIGLLESIMKKARRFLQNFWQKRRIQI